MNGASQPAPGWSFGLDRWLLMKLGWVALALAWRRRQSAERALRAGSMEAPIVEGSVDHRAHRCGITHQRRFRGPPASCGWAVPPATASALSCVHLDGFLGRFSGQNATDQFFGDRLVVLGKHPGARSQWFGVHTWVAQAFVPPRSR